MLTRALEAALGLAHQVEKEPAQDMTGELTQETREAKETGIGHLLKVSGARVVNHLHDECLDLSQEAPKYTDIDRLLREVGADLKALRCTDTISRDVGADPKALRCTDTISREVGADLIALWYTNTISREVGADLIVLRYTDTINREVGADLKALWCIDIISLDTRIQNQKQVISQNQRRGSILKSLPGPNQGLCLERRLH